MPSKKVKERKMAIFITDGEFTKKELDIALDVLTSISSYEMTESDRDIEPPTASWVSKSGKVKFLYDMKTKNLEALKKRFEDHNVQDVFPGMYGAIVAELDERE